MKTPILLMGHCHTGLRLLTKLLHAVGMELGNKESGWVDCTPGQEHPLLSQIGNTLYREIAGIVPPNPQEERLALLRKVLGDYHKQADLNKWDVFGVKNNYFIDPTVWRIISPILLEIWNDIKIIITVRHPIDVHKGINNPDWSLNTVIDSFKRTFDLTKELIGNENTRLVVYPDSFENNASMKELAEWAGLKWKPEVGYLYDKTSTSNRATDSEKEQFAKTHPDAAKQFEELCSVSSGLKKEVKTFGNAVVTPKKTIKRKKSGKSKNNAQ